MKILDITSDNHVRLAIAKSARYRQYVSTNMKMKTLINTILLLFLIQIGFSQEVEMITDWDEAK